MSYPNDHYWKAEDGRVFASARQIITNTEDEEYLAFAKIQRVTDWPRDEYGQQTEEELQTVLRPYGIFVNLKAYAADARWRAVNGGITVNGRPFATDAVTLGSLNSACIYTQGNATAKFSWKLPDGSFVTLAKQDIEKLQGVASKHGQDCYTCEADMIDGIDDGSITTREQIDAAFAAVDSSFDDVVLHERPSAKPQKRPSNKR